MTGSQRCYSGLLQWLSRWRVRLYRSFAVLVKYILHFNQSRFTYVKYQFEIGTGRSASSAQKDRFLNALRLAPAGLSLASLSAKRAMPKPPVYRILRSCWRS